MCGMGEGNKSGGAWRKVLLNRGWGGGVGGGACAMSAVRRAL